MAIELITYFSSIKGLILQLPIELKLSNQSIKNVEIKTESEELNLSFFLNNVFSEDKAKSITYDMAIVLINRISFKCGCKIGQPRLKCILGDGYVQSYEHFSPSDEIDVIISIGEIERKKLRLYLERPIDHIDHSFLQYYYFIINQEDFSFRFLLLYAFLELILVSHKGQKEIDKLILKIDSSVPTSTCPQKIGAKKTEGIKTETLFTRLRNEVMHQSDRNVDPDKTKQEMIDNVGWLQDIVKKYMESEVI